jgi:hypothetical protein
MAVLDHDVGGYWTADGATKVLDIPSGFDFIEVENQTATAAAVGSAGTKYRWRKGMVDGSMFMDAFNAGSTANLTTYVATGGFTPIYQVDPVTPSALLTGTAISNATPPVASSGATGGLANGNYVRIYSAVGAAQFNGYEFTVDTVTANTSFRLPYAPTIVAGTTFSYRYFQYNPSYYPRRRLITAVTTGATTTIKMSVTHNLTAGQLVAFVVPSIFGMTQLNTVHARILSVSTANNTITVDVNSTGFTAFAFPLTAAAAAPYTQAQVVPFGDGIDPTTPLMTSSTLAGATQNEAVAGVSMAPGVNGPAGQASDLIYWRAVKYEQLQTS